MSILVIAEHDNHQLKPATRNTLGAAALLQQPVQVLVVGHACQAVAEQVAHLSGVSHVFVADNANYHYPLAENLAPLIVKMAAGMRYVMAAATTFGKDLLPRVAALLDVAQISAITSIVQHDTFTRGLYAGNAVATVQSKDLCMVLTVQPTAFAAVIECEQMAPITALSDVYVHPRIRCVEQTLSKSERPELTAARVVVAGGRGLQNKENFQLIEALADQLGAAVGASRAAVDAGFVPNDYQVGQTGKMVAPALYIAVGISGAIQHIAGMKESKVIVAINKDEEAPIFQVADYGLVGDLFQILPELMAVLRKE